MAPHSSTLAWEIPWMEEAGGLRSRGLQKSQIQLGDYTQSEKAMAPHSSSLAWKLPWTEEPGGLQSMGSLRVGHD